MPRVRDFFVKLPLLAAAMLMPQSVWAGQGGAGGGKVTIIYEASENYRELAKILDEQKIFDLVAEGIGASYRLPNDITTVFRNCDVPNASYSPARREITMCYELLGMIGENARQYTDDDGIVGQKVIGAAIFFFLHELGHALVHQLDVPITGREEDAVDELAALLILVGDEDQSGAMMLADTADTFGDMASKTQSMDQLAFWGEHPLDAQRMYHLLCMIYGSNPQAYAALVSDTVLPQQRAKRCPFEYKQRERNWNRLLDAHLKS